MSLSGFFLFRWALYAGEVLLSCTPFFLRQKRRSMFYLRLGLSLLTIAGVVFAVSQINLAIFTSQGYTDGAKALTSLLGYLSLSGLVFGAECFLFKEKMPILLSSFAQGYALRSMCFAFYILLIAIIGQEWNYFTMEGALNVVNLLLYLAVYGFAYALYVIIRRKHIFRGDPVLPKGLLPVYAGVLLVLVTLHSFGELYNENDKVLYILFVCAELSCYIILFATDYLLRQNTELQAEKQIVANLLQEQGRQFKFSKANAEDLRMKAHDLKHQIRVLREGGEEAEKLLRSLEEDVDDFESTIYLDNQVLNITLREKWGYCKKHRIRLTYSSDPNAFSALSAVDLFTLCGNILDNAIEATMKLEDKSKRVISVTISYRGGVSILRCDNFYEGDLREENGRYVSSKADRFSHGFGIASIKRIVGAYDGAVDIKYDGGIYVIKVSIPDPEPKEN